MRLLAAATALPTFSMHVFVPSLPAAATALAASPAQIQLTITLYLVGLAFGQLLHGPLSDRFGRRPVILGGLLVYLAGTLGALLAPTLSLLLIGRIFQSVGGCAGLVVGRAAVREVSSAASAAAGLALLAFAITLSSALAPLIGAQLEMWLGWRMVFAALMSVGAVLTLLIYLRLPETNRTPAAALDFAGVGRRLARLMSMPSFLGFSLCGAAATVSAYAFYAALPFLLAEELPEAGGRIGLIYVAVVVGSILGALSARPATRRLPLGVIALIGSAGTVLSAIAFLVGRSLAPDSLTLLVLPLFALTYTGGFANPGAATLAMSVDREAVGTASSLYGFIQMTVGALVTLAVGMFGHDSLTVGMIVLTSVCVGLAGLCCAQHFASR